MPASSPKAALGDPFLLPVCDCGGPMNLASLEPHATRPDQELKTYKCLHCGSSRCSPCSGAPARSATIRAKLALIPYTHCLERGYADALIVRRGRPRNCVSDNGTELTSMEVDTGERRHLAIHRTR